MLLQKIILWDDNIFEILPIPWTSTYFLSNLQFKNLFFFMVQNCRISLPANFLATQLFSPQIHTNYWGAFIIELIIENWAAVDYVFSTAFFPFCLDFLSFRGSIGNINFLYYEYLIQHLLSPLCQTITHIIQRAAFLCWRSLPLR